MRCGAGCGRHFPCPARVSSQAWNRTAMPGTSRCGLIGVVGVANTPARESCLELLVRGQAGNIHDGVGPVRPIGAIAARAGHGACHQAAIVAPVEAHPGAALERLVLHVSGWLNISSWSMRNTPFPPCPAGVAPMPLTWGWKKRAATLEKTTKAVKPWMFGTLARTAYPGSSNGPTRWER